MFQVSTLSHHISMIVTMFPFSLAKFSHFSYSSVTSDLSPLPMMKLISDACHQVSSLIAKATFLLSPQIQMSKNLEELKGDADKFPNMV